MKLRTRSASCQMSSYCCWVIGMTICLAPRGTCVERVFRSRSTCRVFGRASILASPSLKRSRMTKMPPDGYPAFLQYLQSGRVSNFKRVMPASRRAATTPVRCQRIVFHSFRSSHNFLRKPCVSRDATNFLSPFATPSSSFVDPVVDPAARRSLSTWSRAVYPCVAHRPACWNQPRMSWTVTRRRASPRAS